jgi:AAA family ATP:ADP antiporter
VESLFLTVHGSERLPLAWLGVGVGVIATVTLYNRWAARSDLIAVYGVSSGVSGLVLIGLLFGLSVDLGAAVFALYLWKDIYIVVLIETFWAQANSVVPETRAKRVYGLFCVLGSLGGMGGNLLSGVIAERLGTASVLTVVGVLLLGIAIGCRWLLRNTGEGQDRPAAPASFRAGFAVLRRSPMLWLLMGLVATSQVVITLVDYQMNVALEALYTDTDARTAIIGRIYAGIDFLAMVLQLATSHILRWLGITAVLMLIPSLLGAAMASFALLPHFALIVTGKVTSKALDYSLFRAAKEILYIPLSHAERTQGKALVDICSYRVAKGACSLMLLGLAAWGSMGGVSVLTLGIIGVWIAITVAVTRNRR